MLENAASVAMSKVTEPAAFAFPHKAEEVCVVSPAATPRGRSARAAIEVRISEEMEVSRMFGAYFMVEER